MKLTRAIRATKRALTRFRDAMTGRFVKRSYAEKHGDTTVREKLK